jgi:hypothetical protein
LTGTLDYQLNRHRGSKRENRDDMKIERTLFWFKDGNEILTSLNNDFFALGTLLNRLLNQGYDGKKIKFININFFTSKTYELFPVLPMDQPYYFGGHLTYYGVFDRHAYDELTPVEQKTCVWENAHRYLCKAAEAMRNDQLLSAAESAYRVGIENKLNPDYRMVEIEINIKGHLFRASVWVNFKEDGMYSKLTLEQGGRIVFEKDIDATKKGVEFFLEMYKSIEFRDNNIVIKGRKDVDYLPLSVPLNIESLVM